jgi:WD40 repeat protein
VTVKTKVKESSVRSLFVVTGIPHLIAERGAFILLRAEQRRNKTVCLLERRNISTGKLISTRLMSTRAGKTERNAECAALSGDGRQLAMLESSAKDVTFNLFDTRTAKRLRRFTLQKPRLPTRPEPEHRIQSGVYVSDFQPHLAFSRDSSTLAATVGYSTVLFVNSRTGVRQSVITTPHDVQSFAISSDGSHVAISETNGRFTLWNARTGQLMRELVPAKNTSHQLFIPLGDSNSQALYQLAFSPDSAALAAASGDASVALWRIR